MTDNVTKFSRPRPFRVLDIGDLHGRPIPEREWLVPGLLVRGGITLLNGDGGMGKSLLCLQLQVAAALGEQWLGIDLGDPIVSYGFYCEDEEDELHIRLASISKHYGIPFDAIAGKVLYSSRVGEDNTLMSFNYRNDNGSRTATLQQMEELVRLNRVQLIVIDTVADTFQGNENIRPQVRAFVNSIRRLALINRGGVILTAHPSRAGLADGSGLSGSTGWNGSVRSRIYLTKPKTLDKDIDGEEEPTNERLLKVMKSNYGPSGDKVRLKWDAGVFVRTDVSDGPTGIVDRLEEDRNIVQACEWLIKNGAYLAADPNTKSSLVNRVRQLPSCKLISWRAAMAAQDRLLDAQKLVRVELGPQSKRRVYIRPAYLRYPGEHEAGETEGASPHSEANPNDGDGRAV